MVNLLSDDERRRLLRRLKAGRRQRRFEQAASRVVDHLDAVVRAGRLRTIGQLLAALLQRREA